MFIKERVCVYAVRKAVREMKKPFFPLLLLSFLIEAT